MIEGSAPNAEVWKVPSLWSYAVWRCSTFEWGSSSCIDPAVKVQ